MIFILILWLWFGLLAFVFEVIKFRKKGIYFTYYALDYAQTLGWKLICGLIGFFITFSEFLDDL